MVDNVVGTVILLIFLIIDVQGNMLSLTLLFNYPFGSGLIADGTSGGSSIITTQLTHHVGIP